MCIDNSVGQGGKNERLDVRGIQILLNANGGKCGLSAPMTVDGLCGAGTIKALTAFQKALGQAGSGVVVPGDPLLATMREAISAQMGRELLWGTMPGASLANIDRYWEVTAQRMAANGIDTPLRRAHFLAQVGHECADLLYQEELADGSAYEGRKDLGNTQPGDGKRFKGRGLIQLTGRTNYTNYGKARGQDFITGDNPKRIAAEPDLAVDVACWFWTTHDLNTWADQDDVKEVTRRINGGENGLADREARLARAKWFLRV